MTDLDDRIRMTLGGSPPDAEAVAPLHDLIVDSFRGRARWLAVFAWTKIAGGIACTTVAAVAFFAVESTRALVAWATVFGVGMLATMLWWTWYWMLVHRNAEARRSSAWKWRWPRWRAVSTARPPCSEPRDEAGDA